MAARSRAQTRNMAERSRATVPATSIKDFQPQVERKEEQEAYILIIDLPGFPKDKISVTYFDSARTIGVEGEQPLEKNTRNCFNQAFPVPQNCIKENIQASFRNGVLTITMPKVDSVQDADTKKETISPKPITEPKVPTAMGPQNASPEAETNGKKMEALQPPKQQEEKQKKAAPFATTSRQREEKTAGSSTAEIVEKKDLVKEKENGKTKDSTMSESNIPKISEMERNDKAGSAVKEKPKEGGSSFLEKAKEMKGMDTIMKTVKRLATDDYEDRKRLINMGISVFVIVALGAYITYSNRSTGKAKD